MLSYIACSCLEMFNTVCVHRSTHTVRINYGSASANVVIADTSRECVPFFNDNSLQVPDITVVSRSNLLAYGIPNMFDRAKVGGA